MTSSWGGVRRALPYPFTERPCKEAHTDPDQIALAYRLILCHEPRDDEKEIAQQFLTSSLLDELCRALFNLNEFVYAE